MASIAFTLNGEPTTLDVVGDRKLLWVLRGDLGLTGTKFGCGESLCGACTVVVDDAPVRSCQIAVGDVRGRVVTTIEGLSRDARLHPLQEQFIAQGGMQCGFCTSGMIMNAYGLLLRNPRPTRDQVVSAIDGNLCRCSTYKRVLQAIEAMAGSE
jgi:aerobic-type carbon monoxide dehydrogenase small subunit (CoxS/CutS family)